MLHLRDNAYNVKFYRPLNLKSTLHLTLFLYKKPYILYVFLMKNIAQLENIAFKTFIMPADLNFHGTLFGGAMLAYLDKAGAIVAQKRCKSRVFLVAMNKSEFIKPARLNDAITIYAVVSKVGNTSMTVTMEAWREEPITGEIALSAKSEAVYVAIDENLKPCPVDRG